jgi:hypothetical protein
VYTLTGRDGTIVSMRGRVVFPNGATGAQTSVKLAATEYLLGNISGSNVTLEMSDSQGSILDGRADETAPNVSATGNFALVSASSGSIGAAARPLAIVVDGYVMFRDLSAHRRLATDAFLRAVDGNLAFEPGTRVEGATLEAEAANGSILFTDFAAVASAGKAAKVTLRARDNITGSQRLDVVDSNVTLTAEGDITVPVVTGAQGASIQMDADGNVRSVADDGLSVDLNASAMAVVAGGSITLGNLRLGRAAQGRPPVPPST